MTDTTHVGRMLITWAADLPQSKRDALAKAIQTAPKRHADAARKELTLPPLKPLRKPSVDMLEDTVTLGRDANKYVDTVFANPDRPLLVMPERMRREAVVALARTRMKAWLRNPPAHDRKAAAQYEREDLPSILASLSDDVLHKLIESNVAPGARVQGKFAATLVTCWDEVERRKELRLEVAS